MAAAADVHRDDAVVPVRRIGDTVDDPNVVDPVSRRVELETPHAVGIGRVFDADDVVATSVRERVNVPVMDEDIVYAAVQLVVVARDDAHAVGRVADVEDDETVLAIGRTFAADDGGGAVLGDLDVVDGARIHAHGVHELNGVGLGDVPEIGVAVGAPSAGHRVVAPVRRLPDPQVGRVSIAHRPLAQHLDLLAHVARARTLMVLRATWLPATATIV